MTINSLQVTAPSTAMPGGPPGIQGPPGTFTIFGVNNQTGLVYTAKTSDTGKIIIFSGQVMDVNLQLPPMSGLTGWWVVVKNNNLIGRIIITVTGGATIDGQTTLAVDSLSSVQISFTGSNFETLGPTIGALGSLLDQSAVLSAYNNLAINGNMEVDQVRFGALQSAVANGAYVIDMVKLVGVGAQVLSAQQILDAPVGLVKSLKLAVSTANFAPGASDFSAVQFPIEGRNIARLGFGSIGALNIVIGFYVKVFRTGTYAICVSNGAANRSYSTTFTVNATSTWQWVSVTIPGDTTGTWAVDNTLGMLVSIVMMAGSSLSPAPNVWAAAGAQGALGMTNGCQSISDFMQITGVCMYPGSAMPTATRALAMHRGFADSLAACSRYWQKSYNYETVPGAVTTAGAHEVRTTYATAAVYGGVMAVRFPIAMRSTPTVVVFSPTSGSAGFVFDVVNGDVAGTVTNVGQKNFNCSAAMSASANDYHMQFQWSADARL